MHQNEENNRFVENVTIRVPEDDLPEEVHSQKSRRVDFAEEVGFFLVFSDEFQLIAFDHQQFEDPERGLGQLRRDFLRVERLQKKLLKNFYLLRIVLFSDSLANPFREHFSVEVLP